MKREFLLNLRKFIAGEEINLADVLMVIPHLKKRILTDFPKSRFRRSLENLFFRYVFYPEIGDDLSHKIFYDTDLTNPSSIKSIKESYLEVENVEDWKLAISLCSENDSMLSYVNLKNIKKFNIKVKLEQGETTKLLFKYGSTSFSFNSLHSEIGIKSKAKATTVLRFILNHVFRDNSKKLQEVTDFVSNFFKKNSILVNRIVEVSGEEIRRAYSHKNYYEPANRGSLWKSCMRYDYCAPLLSLYVDNPDKVNLVVSYSTTGLVTGRCLIWKDGKNVYYDTIYAYNSFVEDKIKRYLTSKGYLCIKEHDVFIPIKYENYKDLPCLDNLHYFTREGIKNYNDSDVICRYQSFTGGNFVNSDDYVMLENGRYYPLSRVYYSDYLDIYLLRENAEEAFYDIDRISYFPIEDIAFSIIEDCSLYITSPNVVYLPYVEDYAFLNNCVEDVDGFLRHIKHVKYSDELEGYVFDEERVKN